MGKETFRCCFQVVPCLLSLSVCPFWFLSRLFHSLPCSLLASVFFLQVSALLPRLVHRVNETRFEDSGWTPCCTCSEPDVTETCKPQASGAGDVAERQGHSSRLLSTLLSTSQHRDGAGCPPRLIVVITLQSI